MAKRLRGSELPPFTYLEPWGEFGSPGYNRAKIELNGHVFDVLFYGKHHGYSGWYQASKDRKKVLRPYVKFSPLLRDLDYQFQREE